MLARELIFTDITRVQRAFTLLSADGRPLAAALAQRTKWQRLGVDAVGVAGAKRRLAVCIEFLRNVTPLKRGATICLCRGGHSSPNGRDMRMAASREITRSPSAQKALSKAPPVAKRGAIQTDISPGTGTVVYVRSKGVDDFVASVHAADPIRLVETERSGVAGSFVKDLSRRMEIPAQRMFVMLGVPKATVEKRAAADQPLTGTGGRAALGMAKLLGRAREIVDNSTAPEVRGFDAAKWLGQWLEKPQPALGGRRPSELVDTPTGLEMVLKLLGAIESGAYL